MSDLFTIRGSGTNLSNNPVYNAYTFFAQDGQGTATSSTGNDIALYAGSCGINATVAGMGSGGNVALNGGSGYTAGVGGIGGGIALTAGSGAQGGGITIGAGTGNTASDTGSIWLQANGAILSLVGNTTGGTLNYLQLQGGASATALSDAASPTITAATVGSDTDINIRLVPMGTGRVKVAGSVDVTGTYYINGVAFTSGGTWASGSVSSPGLANQTTANTGIYSSASTTDIDFAISGQRTLNIHSVGATANYLEIDNALTGHAVALYARGTDNSPPIYIQGGNGTNSGNQGGTAYVYGGYGNAAGTSTGGTAILRGGYGGATAGDGGQVQVLGGDATTSGNGGTAYLYGGTAIGTGIGGAIYIKSGAAASSNATGQIQIYSANATSANSGALSITTGTTTTSGNSGAITIATGTAAGTAGNIAINTNSNGSSGVIYLQSGQITANISTAASFFAIQNTAAYSNSNQTYIGFNLLDSSSSQARYGTITIKSLDTTHSAIYSTMEFATAVNGSTATRLTIGAGSGSGSGGMYMAGASGGDKGAGTINATGYYLNGALSITGATNATMQAGSVSGSTTAYSLTIQGGAQGGTGAGGNIFIHSGLPTSGNGGNITLETAAAATSGNGGNLIFNADNGAGASGNGGSILMQAGSLAGSGTNGTITMSTAWGAEVTVLNGVLLAAATGGAKGAGTLNATGVYVNNVQVITGSSPTITTPTLYYATTNNIAAAGSNQSTATQLTTEVNIVGTVGAGQGVKLPQATAGMYCVIDNDTNTSLLVYPYTSQSIDDGTVNAPITIPGQQTWSAYANSVNNWETVSPTIQAGSAITVAASAATITISSPITYYFRGIT